MTMSDANGRPIMTSTPGDAVPFRIGGAPVVIAMQMPDVAPGSTRFDGVCNETVLIVVDYRAGSSEPVHPGIPPGPSETARP
jgi:HK97 family phage major capsid protein